MSRIHPTADVQTAAVGAGTQIWQYTVVLPGARIGRDCNLNAHCLVENDVVIGDRVTLKCGVFLWDGMTVEDDVFIGPNATFTNDKFPRSRKHPAEFQRIVLKRGASIGARRAAFRIGPPCRKPSFWRPWATRWCTAPTLSPATANMAMPC